jgi:hypothetical protein
MYYVYEHYKKDTDQIFYVGIGKKEDGKYQRSKSTAKRNPHWHSTTKKHGFYSKIVFESESSSDADEVPAPKGKRKATTSTKPPKGNKM